jgi:hypothetical protein
MHHLAKHSSGVARWVLTNSSLHARSAWNWRWRWLMLHWTLTTPGENCVRVQRLLPLDTTGVWNTHALAAVRFSHVTHVYPGFFALPVTVR